MIVSPLSKFGKLMIRSDYYLLHCKNSEHIVIVTNIALVLAKARYLDRFSKI